MTDTGAAPPNILLPHPLPDDPIARTILIALRRMAIGGLADAHAATAMLGQFGIGYRRPLMFLRILMQEVSRGATRSIAIAPSCCCRITEGEAAFLLLIDCARAHPEVARATLARSTGTLDCLPALAVAQALGEALAELGRPLLL